MGILNILTVVLAHPFLAGCVGWILVGIIINAYRLWHEDDLLIIFFAFPLATLLLLAGTVLAWPILFIWSKRPADQLPYEKLW